MKNIPTYNQFLNEAKNTITLAFYKLKDYKEFKEFVRDKGWELYKDFSWSDKMKVYSIEIDVSVLEDIYGVGTSGNKNSGWYSALAADFKSSIII